MKSIKTILLVSLATCCANLDPLIAQQIAPLAPMPGGYWIQPGYSAVIPAYAVAPDDSSLPSIVQGPVAAGGGVVAPAPAVMNAAAVPQPGPGAHSGNCGCSSCQSTWSSYPNDPTACSDGGCVGGGLGLGLGLGQPGRGLGLGLGNGFGHGIGQGCLARHANWWRNLWGPKVCRPVWVYGGAEYLLWWNKDRSVPPLVTTSPPNTPSDQAGVLGQPGTTILFGGEDIDHDHNSGVRGTLGFWLDGYQTWGVVFRAFSLEDENIGFSAGSLGDPILARPFFNVDLGMQDSELIAYPGISEGSINANTTNGISAGEFFFRGLLYSGYCNRIDFIFGYHYTEIQDATTVQHSVTSTGGGIVPVGTQVDTVDAFEVDNEFHGGQIGLMAEANDGRLTWSALTKLSMGNMKQTMRIHGNTVVTDPAGGSVTRDFGLLALPTNIGVYEDDQFALVPELNLSVAYSITGRIQLSVGYSAIYWSDVQLSGDAIDLAVNPTQMQQLRPIIGPPRPEFSFSDSNYWVQGLNFGIHGRF